MNEQDGYIQDFPDAANLRPLASISNVVSHVSLYHMIDGHDKIVQIKAWKKKVRDILANHQEHIIQFFTKPLNPDHPLLAAHTLLGKYGKAPPQYAYDKSRTPSITFRECVLDLSGQGFLDLNRYIANIEALRINETPQIKWMSMTKQLLDYMRDVGDELIRLDQKLKDECSNLDNIIDTIVQVVNLPHPELPGFKEMMEKYIEIQFRNQPIEKLYWDYIYTLQKYSGLRDMLMPQRMSQPSNDPACCICMLEPVIIAFIPCGHTFCTNCAKRALVCFICRQVVTNRLRLFFG